MRDKVGMMQRSLSQNHIRLKEETSFASSYVNLFPLLQFMSCLFVSSMLKPKKLPGLHGFCLRNKTLGRYQNMKLNSLEDFSKAAGLGRFPLWESGWFFSIPSFSIQKHMDVSKNSGGPPKSSIWIGFSLINHPFWGTIIFGNTHMLGPQVSTSGLVKKIE